jgi:hypothetical protein
LGRGKHFELGFSSLAAYALERCDRSVRWVEGARCLARRLEQLPELRRAIAWGAVSWSMGELLARVAQPQDEASWLEAAKGRTVREMRARVLNPLGEACAATAEPPASENTEGEEGDDTCTLSCSVDREEAWLFEATRALLAQLGAHGADAQVEALLAEGQETVLAALPAGRVHPDGSEGAVAARRRCLEALSRWRAEAEALCEKHFRRLLVRSGPDVHPKKAESACSSTLGGRDGSVANAAALGLASLEGVGCDELDDMLRELSRSLARHELELSQLVLQFHRADGWRHLGYASETQYARERLGISHSLLMARRALALRLETLPCVAAALRVGQLGVEAAVQVVRVATSSTEAAWVERARQRTIKHLREEVAATLMAVRLTGEIGCPPPLDAEMVAFHELERAVVSGRICESKPELDGVRLAEPGSAPRRAWRVMLGSLAQWLRGGLQASAARSRAPAPSVRSKGRVELRWRVSRANHTWWRGLEKQARRWLPSGTSWLKFLCLSLWNAWRHVLGPNVAYGQVYIRDRCQCSSPVCCRRDVTPHHLQFRSAGGSDEDENVAAVCTWCHLFGVHGGRIRAAGTAERIRWELGAAGRPCLVVDGRERLAR